MNLKRVSIVVKTKVSITAFKKDNFTINFITILEVIKQIPTTEVVCSLFNM